MATEPIPQPGDDVPRLYCNFVQVNGGVLDVTVDFGRQLPPGLRVEWLTRITMTWEEARLLSNFLQSHIERIEKSMGTPVRDLIEINRRAAEQSAEGTA